MSQDIADIHGDGADFASGKEVQCHFYRSVFEEKAPFAFLGGRPQPLEKPSTIQQNGWSVKKIELKNEGYRDAPKYDPYGSFYEEKTWG